MRYSILASFCTTNAQVQVISPNGGETWIYGSTATIQWQNMGVPDIYSPPPGVVYYQGAEVSVQWWTGNPGPVDIRFSSDNGLTWMQVGARITSYPFHRCCSSIHHL